MKSFGALCLLVSLMAQGSFAGTFSRGELWLMRARVANEVKSANSEGLMIVTETSKENPDLAADPNGTQVDSTFSDLFFTKLSLNDSGNTVFKINSGEFVHIFGSTHNSTSEFFGEFKNAKRIGADADTAELGLSVKYNQGSPNQVEYGDTVFSMGELDATKCGTSDSFRLGGGMFSGGITGGRATCKPADAEAVEFFYVTFSRSDDKSEIQLFVPSLVLIGDERVKFEAGVKRFHQLALSGGSINAWSSVSNLIRSRYNAYERARDLAAGENDPVKKAPLIQEKLKRYRLAREALKKAMIALVPSIVN